MTKSGADISDLDPVAHWPRLPDLGEEPNVNISGLACGPKKDGRRTCVVVYDEKRHAAVLTLKDETFSDPAKIRLLSKAADPTPGLKPDDADLEAVAYDGGWCWVFGSHSRKKKMTGPEGTALRPSRRHIYRFPVTEDGAPDFDLGGDEPSGKVEMVSDLFTRLDIAPTLRDRLEAPILLKDGGVNIEGGTVVGGRMYLGFRAASWPNPSETEGALVLSFSAAALFAGAGVATDVSILPLGLGMGIRDLISVGNAPPHGFLVLAGSALPDDDDAEEAGARRPASLWFWAGVGASPIYLATLAGVPEHGKPETLLLLDDDDDAWSVLVLCDGVDGGGPAEYRVPKPPR